jgi:hypothetical protein
MRSRKCAFRASARVGGSLRWCHSPPQNAAAPVPLAKRPQRRVQVQSGIEHGDRLVHGLVQVEVPEDVGACEGTYETGAGRSRCSAYARDPAAAAALAEPPHLRGVGRLANGRPVSAAPVLVVVPFRCRRTEVPLGGSHGAKALGHVKLHHSSGAHFACRGCRPVQQKISLRWSHSSCLWRPSGHGSAKTVNKQLIARGSGRSLTCELEVAVHVVLTWATVATCISGLRFSFSPKAAAAMLAPRCVLSRASSSHASLRLRLLGSRPATRGFASAAEKPPVPLERADAVYDPDYAAARKAALEQYGSLGCVSM